MLYIVLFIHQGVGMPKNCQNCLTLVPKFHCVDCGEHNGWQNHTSLEDVFPTPPADENIDSE